MVGKAATIRYKSDVKQGLSSCCEVTDCWVRNLAILHRHIEVHADEDTFALEGEVGDGKFVG